MTGKNLSKWHHPWQAQSGQAPQDENLEQIEALRKTATHQHHHHQKGSHKHRKVHLGSLPQPGCNGQTDSRVVTTAAEGPLHKWEKALGPGQHNWSQKEKKTCVRQLQAAVKAADERIQEAEV